MNSAVENRRPASTGLCPDQRLDGDRDAVQDRVARQRVEQRRVGQEVAVHARAMVEATESCTPSTSWPQPWGMLTTPGMIPSVTSTGRDDRPGARSDLGLVAVRQPERGRRRRGGRAACTAACPSPAPRCCASTSCSSAGAAGRRGRSRGRCRRSDRAVEGGLEPGQVGDERLGRELDHPRRRAQHVGQSRLERPEIDAVRVGLQHVERQSVRVPRRSSRRRDRFAA